MNCRLSIRHDTAHVQTSTHTHKCKRREKRNRDEKKKKKKPVFCILYRQMNKRNEIERDQTFTSLSYCHYLTNITVTFASLLRRFCWTAECMLFRPIVVNICLPQHFCSFSSYFYFLLLFRLPCAHTILVASVRFYDDLRAEEWRLRSRRRNR